MLLEQSNAAVGAAEDVKQGNNDQQIALGETLDAVNGIIECFIVGIAAGPNNDITTWEPAKYHSLDGANGRLRTRPPAVARGVSQSGLRYPLPEEPPWRGGGLRHPHCHGPAGGGRHLLGDHPRRGPAERPLLSACREWETPRNRQVRREIGARRHVGQGGSWFGFLIFFSGVIQ